MKMMKKAMSFLIAAGFLITLATPVSAESQTGSDQWQVAFDGQKMKANYTAADFADSFSDLQPGDTVSIEITLKNVCGEKQTGTFRTIFWIFLKKRMRPMARIPIS